jgi:protein-S-isoprenylcysteine O-methyltransferase Ste14
MFIPGLGTLAGVTLPRDRWFAPGYAALAAFFALEGALRAYRRCMAVEEELLADQLPGYADYRGRTKKLIPFVW